MKLSLELTATLVVSLALTTLSSTTAGEQIEKQASAKDTGRFPPPEGLLRLAKDAQLWIDIKNKMVVVDGQVALRSGQLEMFACPKGTKEHESVIAIHAKAQYVHAGLLALGAKKGSPVKFEPEYSPASGTTIDIWVLWRDKQGKRQRVRAQEWIRNIETQKEMKYDWVFAGSGFWKDPTDGVEYYYGDSGDFICVSNFPSATLDLPVESSQANASLMFEAFSDRIPQRGTPIRLVLKPRLTDKENREKKNDKQAE
jgi:hypothetical protein